MKKQEREVWREIQKHYNYYSKQEMKKRGQTEDNIKITRLDDDRYLFTQVMTKDGQNYVFVQIYDRKTKKFTNKISFVVI